MKKRIFAVLLLAMSFFIVPDISGVTFDDGGPHIVDYVINDNVFITGSDTTVDIHQGAHIQYYDYLTQGVLVEDGAAVSMSGGYIYGYLWCSNDHITVVSGGDIGLILMFGSEFDFQGGITESVEIGSDCQAMLTGGTMGQLYTSGDSRVDFSGGNASSVVLTSEASLITFVGSDFQVNGVSVGYGDSARDYAIPIDYYGSPCLTGDLTGTLQDGQLLDVPFYILDNSDIVFVPEPGTVVLLLAGSLVLRKRSA